MPTLNDIPTPYVLWLCAIFGLAAALLCVVIGRGAWRWWRLKQCALRLTRMKRWAWRWRRRRTYGNVVRHKGYLFMTGTKPDPDKERLYVWTKPSDPDAWPVLERAPLDKEFDPNINPATDCYGGYHKDSAAVPYKPQGGPVPNAPVTRAEFDAVLSRLAILEGAKRGMREQLGLGWSMMSLRGLGGYNGMNPAMRQILDHPPATESDFRKDIERERVAVKARQMGAEPDSGIRVWEWNNGYTSPTNWLWDGKKMWHRDHVFPWGDAPASPSPARLLKTNAHLDVRELHGDEKARVVADWRENKPK